MSNISEISRADIEHILRAYGVGSEQEEVARGPRPPEQLRAMVRDIKILTTTPVPTTVN